MLSCLSLLTDVTDLGNIDCIYQQANNQAENLLKVHSINTSSFIFLGDGVLFPIGMYGALKVNEIFGSKSYAYTIEEFCHSPIFGTKKTNPLWILGQNEGPVRDSLSRLSFNVSYQELNEPDRLTQLFQTIFFVQIIIFYGLTKIFYVVIILQTSCPLNLTNNLNL